MARTRLWPLLFMAELILHVCEGQLVVGGLRLVDSAGQSQASPQGWVLVQVQGQWGPVCDDLWEVKAASVVCRQLGFMLGGVAVRNSYQGAGLGTARLHEAHCNGTELDLNQCRLAASPNTQCDSTEVAGVNCTVATTTTPTTTPMTQPSAPPSTIAGQLVVGGLRLVDSAGQSQASPQGWVLVQVQGQWGPVCDDLWEVKAASVVCRQLGFTLGGVAVRNSYQGAGLGTARLHEAHCNGTELDLNQCRLAASPNTQCGVTEVAGVNCTVAPTTTTMTNTTTTTTNTTTTAAATITTQTTRGTATASVATPTSPTTPRLNLEGAKIFKNASFAANSTAIAVRWEVQDNVTGLALTVRVQSRPVALGDCQNLTSEPAVSVQDAGAGGVTLQAEPWRRHLVDVSAFSSDATLELAESLPQQSVLTAEEKPIGVVTGFTIVSLTSTEAMITWTDVPCAERRGALVRYEAVVNMTSGEAPRYLRVPSTSLIIEQLPTDVTVELKVRYVNGMGEGPYSAPFRFDSLRVPDGVTVETYRSSSTGLELRVSAPSSVSGAVVQYQVKYSSSSDFAADSTRTVTLPANSTSLSLSGLLPSQLYYIQMRGGNSRGWGNWSDVIQLRTLTGVPSAPTGLSGVLSNASCANVTWGPPQLPNGAIVQYKVTFQLVIEGSNPPITERVLDASSTSFLICGLGPGTTFTFTVAAATSAGFGEAASLTLKIPPLTSEPTTTSSGVIIGVTVGVIIFVLIALGVALGVVIWYRRRSPPPTLKMPLMETPKEILPLAVFPECQSEKYWSRTTSLSQERVMARRRDSVQGRGRRMNEAPDGTPHGSRFITFQEEFRSLPGDLLASASEGRSGRNRGRNRYPDLLPYDNTRVLLRPDASSANTYVNASFITGFQQQANYIAAQSPFDSETALDFWRLIYQHGLVTVVDLAKSKKEKKGHSIKYVPDDTSPTLTFGTLDVTLVEREVYANYVIKTVNLASVGAGTKRTVRVFKFTSWPKQGVPDDAIPLLGMRRKVVQAHAREATPLLVLCDSGMDRAGVYIAVDALIRQYCAEEKVNVHKFVLGMRKERAHMVPTFPHYVFLYDAILEELHAGDTTVGFDLKEKYTALAQKNPQTGHSFLSEQFRLLGRLFPAPTPQQCSAALLPANRGKNKYHDVIPRDDHRPILSTPEDPRLGTDYINAVFLDSPRRKRQFLVTQCPLESTAGDLWRLVWESGASAVVLLEAGDREGQLWTQHWPDSGVAVYGNIEVEATALEQVDYVTVRDFRLRNILQPQEPAHHLRHFQFQGWTEPELTPAFRTIVLDLLDLVQDWQQSSKRERQPIVVQCLDGATASGLFVALWNVCQEMLDHKEVDIYHAVRQLRKRRRQILSHMDQYKFCYKTLWDYINLRMRGGVMAETLGQTASEGILGHADWGTLTLQHTL